MTDVQTVRSCQRATELDPVFTAEGFCAPNHTHLSAGSIAMLKARPRMDEILRSLPGSSLVVAPSDQDLRLIRPSPPGWKSRSAVADIPRASAQRCCKWRGIMSVRRWTIAKSVYELHANGGMPVMATSAPAQLRRLRSVGEWRCAATRRADAEDRAERDPQCPHGGATTRRGARPHRRSFGRRSFRRRSFWRCSHWCRSRWCRSNRHQSTGAAFAGALRGEQHRASCHCNGIRR